MPAGAAATADAHYALGAFDGAGDGEGPAAWAGAGAAGSAAAATHRPRAAGRRCAGRRSAAAVSQRGRCDSRSRRRGHQRHAGRGLGDAFGLRERSGFAAFRSAFCCWSCRARSSIETTTSGRSRPKRLKYRCSMNWGSGAFQGSCRWLSIDPSFLAFIPSSRAICTCAWERWCLGFLIRPRSSACTCVRCHTGTNRCVRS